MKQKISILLLTLAAVSCGNSDVIGPYGSTEIPEQVSVKEIVNYPGKSVIYYNLPDDINLKYVKATYVPRGSETVEAKASFYTDSLVVEGFGKAGEYEVRLYSVSYGETESKPVIATVNPDTPAYEHTFESLQATATFGGIYVNFDNPSKGDLAISVRKKNEQDKWEDLYTQYTSAASGTFSVRGQESVPSIFGIQVTDRWGNSSEIKEEAMTPIFEALCDKSKFAKLTLAGDTYLCHTWGNESNRNDMTFIWDGQLLDVPCFQTKTNATMPQHFTFDMGEEYKLSRFVLWTRNLSVQLFQKGHVRHFEVYGSVGYNPSGALFDENGELDPTWFLIGRYESKRPSGKETAVSSSSPLTDEDTAVLTTGEEFMVDEDCPSARYIRIRTLDTWGKTQYMYLGEVSFYGQNVNNIQ